jgi:hypothetical protein
MNETVQSALSGVTNAAGKADRADARRDAIRKDTISTIKETRRI